VTSASGGTRRNGPAASARALLCLVLLTLGRPAQSLADTLAVPLSDAAFWSLTAELSEPSGQFPSDNLMSNESRFQHVIPDLQRRVMPGGVYVGVGPEQNFTYIVAVQPKLAFIVDLRRQNMLEHLLYKAIVELAPDRAEFLSVLFGRPRPPSLGPDSSIKAIIDAYRAAPRDTPAAEHHLQAIRDRLVTTHGFPLTETDLEQLTSVYHSFAEDGPDLTYSFAGAGPGVKALFPTYGSLMTETDAEGIPRSYLASEDRYQALRRLHLANAIVPVVGNFTGPKALRGVGRYLKDHDATVTAFYTSNVEFYLYQDRTWGQFCRNVSTLPLDGTSTFIRSVRDPSIEPRVGLRSELSGIAREVAACDPPAADPRP
jgi:hypothetical protein